MVDQQGLDAFTETSTDTGADVGNRTQAQSEESDVDMGEVPATLPEFDADPTDRGDPPREWELETHSVAPESKPAQYKEYTRFVQEGREPLVVETKPGEGGPHGRVYRVLDEENDIYPVYRTNRDTAFQVAEQYMNDAPYPILVGGPLIDPGFHNEVGLPSLETVEERYGDRDNDKITDHLKTVRETQDEWWLTFGEYIAEGLLGSADGPFGHHVDATRAIQDWFKPFDHRGDADFTVSQPFRNAAWEDVIGDPQTISFGQMPNPHAAQVLASYAANEYPDRFRYALHRVRKEYYTAMIGLADRYQSLEEARRFLEDPPETFHHWEQADIELPSEEGFAFRGMYTPPNEEQPADSLLIVFRDGDHPSAWIIESDRYFQTRKARRSQDSGIEIGDDIRYDYQATPAPLTMLDAVEGAIEAMETHPE